MHALTFLRAAFGASSASLILAGCSTIGSQGLPAYPTEFTPGFRSAVPAVIPDKHKPHIFSAMYANNTLSEYDLAGNFIRSTTAALNDPQGVAIDSKGKIYVANYSSGTVTTYTQSLKQTTPTITTGLNGPVGVAVDASGKIYVTN